MRRARGLRASAARRVSIAGTAGPASGTRLSVYARPPTRETTADQDARERRGVTRDRLARDDQDDDPRHPHPLGAAFRLLWRLATPVAAVTLDGLDCRFRLPSAAADEGLADSGRRLAEPPTGRTSDVSPMPLAGLDRFALGGHTIRLSPRIEMHAACRAAAAATLEGFLRAPGDDRQAGGLCRLTSGREREPKCLTCNGDCRPNPFRESGVRGGKTCSATDARPPRPALPTPSSC